MSELIINKCSADCSASTNVHPSSNNIIPKGIFLRDNTYWYRICFRDPVTHKKREKKGSLKTKNVTEAITRFNNIKSKFFEQPTLHQVPLLEESGYLYKYKTYIAMLKQIDEEIIAIRNNTSTEDYPKLRLQELYKKVDSVAFDRDESWIFSCGKTGYQDYTNFLKLNNFATVQDHQANINREAFGIPFYYKSKFETLDFIPSLPSPNLTPTSFNNPKAQPQVQPQQQTQPTSQYTIKTLIEKTIKQFPNKKNNNLIAANLHRIFKALKLEEDTVFNFEDVEDTTNDVLSWLETQSFRGSTIKHYKAHYGYFLNTLQKECSDKDTWVLIGNTQKQFKDTPIKQKRTVKYTKFTPDQVKQIFNFDNDYFKTRPDEFWSCAITLFSGARTSLCRSPQYKDIITQNGVSCIRYKDQYETHDHKIKDTRYKNTASVRIVPIHPQLIKLGLVDFINARKKEKQAKDNDFIFGTFFNKNDDFKSNLTRSFSNYLKQIGIKPENFSDELELSTHYCFHSLRKVAASTMKDHGLDQDYVNGLIGWEGKDTQSKHYTERRDLSDLIYANSKFDYEYLQSDFDKWAQHWSTYHDNK